MEPTAIPTPKPSTDATTVRAIVDYTAADVWTNHVPLSIAASLSDDTLRVCVRFVY